MSKLNKVVGGTVLAGAGLETAALAGSEVAGKIMDSIIDPVSNLTQSILEGVDLSSISGFIGQNAPLSNMGWADLVGPSMFGVAGGYIGNKASKKLGEWTGTNNTTDDTVAGLSGMLSGFGFGLGSVGLATAGITGLSYVGSRKVFEKILPASYVHLAKYMALAPAGIISSMTGLTAIELAASVGGVAGATIFGVNKIKEA